MSNDDNSNHFHFHKMKYLHKDKSSIDDDSTDHYGFDYNYNRRKDTLQELENIENDKINYGFSNQETQKKNKSKIFWILLISIILIFYLSMSGMSGYIAWNEFPEDNNFNKLVKTYVAVLFSPFYLLYIFIKMTFFKKKI